MPRPPRIEYPGAIYHVTSRGNGRRTIFREDADCERFLAQLAESLDTYGVVLYAYALMGNHYRIPGTGHSIRMILWTYDATTGRLATMTRADGSFLRYGYDPRGADRLTSVTVHAGAAVQPPLAGTTQQNFVYDGPGRRLASADNNDSASPADDADCAWLYDSLGRRGFGDGLVYSTLPTPTSSATPAGAARRRLRR